MNLTGSRTRPAASAARPAASAPVNIYHLQPLVAGPLNTWPAIFQHIAALGFSHVCVAPPFRPGASGDIFVHSSFDELHPALGFCGTAEQGIAVAAEMASKVGLRLLLDIAPGQVALDSPLRQRHTEWFPAATADFADPRRQPQRIDVAVPCFGRTAVADAVADWWTGLLTRLTGAGVAGFRCVGLGLAPPAFWRRLTAACPDALFLAWTPGVARPRDFAGAGFDFCCSSTAWWDGRASWFFDEAITLRDVAPALASPEPSFNERLARRVQSDTDIPSVYRLSLRIAASTGAGLFVPMGFEFATGRQFDPARASPADWQAVAARDAGRSVR